MGPPSRPLKRMKRVKRAWQIGDTVLCKIKGHPFWPAVVADPSLYGKQPRANRLFVAFFGSTEWAFSPKANVFPYEGELRRKCIEKAKKLPDLQLAVDEADIERNNSTGAINAEHEEGQDAINDEQREGQEHPCPAIIEVRDPAIIEVQEGDQVQAEQEREQQKEQVDPIVCEPAEAAEEEDDVQLVEERPSNLRGRKTKRQAFLMEMSADKPSPKRHKTGRVLKAIAPVGRSGYQEEVAPVLAQTSSADQRGNISSDEHTSFGDGKMWPHNQERARAPTSDPSAQMESLQVQTDVDGVGSMMSVAKTEVPAGATPVQGQFQMATKRKPGRPKKQQGGDAEVGHGFRIGHSVPVSAEAFPQRQASTGALPRNQGSEALPLNVPPQQMRTLNVSDNGLVADLSGLDSPIKRKRGRPRLEQTVETVVNIPPEVVREEGLASVPAGHEEMKTARKLGRPPKHGSRLEQCVGGEVAGKHEQVMAVKLEQQSLTVPGSGEGRQGPGGVGLDEVGMKRRLNRTVTVTPAVSLAGERRKARTGWASGGAHNTFVAMDPGGKVGRDGGQVSAEERARIAAEEAEEAAVILVEGPELKEAVPLRASSAGPHGQKQSSLEGVILRGGIDLNRAVDYTCADIASGAEVGQSNFGKSGRKAWKKGDKEVPISVAAEPMVEDGLAVLAGEAGAVESRDTSARSLVAASVPRKKLQKVGSDMPIGMARSAREDGLAELASEAHKAGLDMGVPEATRKRGRPPKTGFPKELQPRTTPMQAVKAAEPAKNLGSDRSCAPTAGLPEARKGGQSLAAAEVVVKVKGGVGVDALSEDGRDRRSGCAESLPAVMFQTAASVLSKRDAVVSEEASVPTGAGARSGPAVAVNSEAEAGDMLNGREEGLPDAAEGRRAGKKLKSGVPTPSAGRGIGGVTGKEGKSGGVLQRKGLAKSLESKEEEIVKGAETLRKRSDGSSGLSQVMQNLKDLVPKSAAREGNTAAETVNKALKGLLDTPAGQLASERKSKMLSGENVSNLQSRARPTGAQKASVSSAAGDVAKRRGTGREGSQEQKKKVALEGETVREVPQEQKKKAGGEGGLGREGLEEQKKKRGGEGVSGREASQEQKKRRVGEIEKTAAGAKVKRTTSLQKVGSGHAADKALLVESDAVVRGGKASNGGLSQQDRGEELKKKSPMPVPPRLSSQQQERAEDLKKKSPVPVPAQLSVEEAKDKLRRSYMAAKEKKERRVVKVLDVASAPIRGLAQQQRPPEKRKEAEAPNMGALIAEAKAKQQALALKNKATPAEPDLESFHSPPDSSSGGSDPLPTQLASDFRDERARTSTRFMDAATADFGGPGPSVHASASPIERAASQEALIPPSILEGLDTDSVIALEALAGMLETLSRNRDSISRATKQAMAAARLGLAKKVIEVIAQRCESERCMPKRVDLFFLVDSIAQAGHRKRGVNSHYRPVVEEALCRFLIAAAPRGSPARANRKDCLKVLKVWHEREILPRPMLDHFVAEIKKIDERSGSPRRARWTQRGIDDPLRDMEGFVDEYGSNSFSTIGLSLKLADEDFDGEYSEPIEENDDAAPPSLPVLDQPSPEKAPEDPVLASEWESQPSPKETPSSMKETQPSVEGTEACLNTGADCLNTRDELPDDLPPFPDAPARHSTSPQYCPESAGESASFLPTPPVESPATLLPLPPLPPSPPPSPPPLPEDSPPPWPAPNSLLLSTPQPETLPTYASRFDQADGAVSVASPGRWPLVLPGAQHLAEPLATGISELGASMPHLLGAPSMEFGIAVGVGQSSSPEERTHMGVSPPFVPRPPLVPPPANVGRYHVVGVGLGEAASAGKSWLPLPTLDRQKMAGVPSPDGAEMDGAERQVLGGEQRGGRAVSPEARVKELELLQQQLQLQPKAGQLALEGGGNGDAALPPLPSVMPRPVAKISPTKPVLPPRMLPPWPVPSQPVLTASCYSKPSSSGPPRPRPQVARQPELAQLSSPAMATSLPVTYGMPGALSGLPSRPVGMYSLPPTHISAPMHGPRHYYPVQPRPMAARPAAPIPYMGGITAAAQGYLQYAPQQSVVYQHQPLPPPYGSQGNLRPQRPWR